tara:strand:- start:1018 stop:2151 length:1134 start_codon:yes stop_codon:yes gene_type:complete
MKRRVAIIGAGVAGLTLGSLLQSNSNFEFTIYEKDRTLNLDEGFGIQLSVNSVAILNKIGFSKINKNEKYHPFKIDFYSIDCNKVCDLDLTTFNSENEKYTTLKRSNLISFLKEKFYSNSIMFGKKIKEVQQLGKKIIINFIDGTSDMVDYLIVSDGIFSETKSIIEKNFFKTKYYGAVAVRPEIITQDIPEINKNNISLIMGSNVHLVLYPINIHKEINLVCISRKKSKNVEDVKMFLENTALRENKNLVNLFKGDLKSWPIYRSNNPIKSIYKNVFYIGDAFYTFPPTLAQGASQSIEAANEIFDLINNNDTDIQNKYFKNRIKRTNLINNRSKFNYFGFHISNPFLRILRNEFLKYLVKNKNFIQNYLGKVYKK